MRKATMMVLAGALTMSGAIGCESMNNPFSSKGTTSMPLTASSTMPAAQGMVQVAPAGKEQKLRVSVEHVAPPWKINPNATAYVVWLKPHGAPHPINIGVLSVNDDLKGTLETRTPFREFQIFVTPESSVSATSPSNDRVMQAQVQAAPRAVK